MHTLSKHHYVLFLLNAKNIEKRVKGKNYSSCCNYYGVLMFQKMHQILKRFLSSQDFYQMFEKYLGQFAFDDHCL